MKTINIYEEAKMYFFEMLDNGIEGETLEELHANNGGEVEYIYSVYTPELFQAIVSENIFSYLEEVEKEFWEGIGTNPLLINIAIERYMLDNYGGFNAKDFE